MKPKIAIKHLNFIIDTQKTVSTTKLKELVQVISQDSRVLTADNKHLRKRIKRQRKALERMNKQ